MKGIILVGGMGTRLRPLTWDTPKSLVPVLNKPFLEYVLRHLKKHGVDEVILALSNLASPIQECFGDGHDLEMKISYVVEKSALGTGGAIKNAAGDLSGDSFLVLNGDIFSDFDYTDMLKFHRQHRSSATIALTPVDDPTLYGLIETTDSLRVTRFLEKPKAQEVTTNLINAGAYILEPDLLDIIPSETEYSVERQLFPSMLKAGSSVYAFPSSGYWIDIGSPEKYSRLNFDLLCGNVASYGFQNNCDIIVGYNSQIHPTARLEGPVLLGENCVVGSNVTIKGPTVIGSRCRIEEEAFVSTSVIWQGVTVGRGCRFVSGIAADDCALQQGCEIEQAVLGNNVTILKNYKLASGTKVEPRQTIG
ncbi:MAG: NDP-sugar synthase [Dehalococcoidia bacterium]|nr:NDP-sugar synthase [Dehalococcoidia bacterium]